MSILFWVLSMFCSLLILINSKESRHFQLVNALHDNDLEIFLATNADEANAFFDHHRSIPSTPPLVSSNPLILTQEEQEQQGRRQEDLRDENQDRSILHSSRSFPQSLRQRSRLVSGHHLRTIEPSVEGLNNVVPIDVSTTEERNEEQQQFVSSPAPVLLSTQSQPPQYSRLPPTDSRLWSVAPPSYHSIHPLTLSSSFANDNLAMTGRGETSERPPLRRYAAYIAPLFNVPLLVSDQDDDEHPGAEVTEDYHQEEESSEEEKNEAENRQRPSEFDSSPATTTEQPMHEREEGEGNVGGWQQGEHDMTLFSVSAAHRLRILYSLWKTMHGAIRQQLRLAYESSFLNDGNDNNSNNHHDETSMTLPLYREEIDRLVQPFEIFFSDVEYFPQQDGSFVVRLRQDHPMYDWYTLETDETYFFSSVAQSLLRSILRRYTILANLLLLSPVLIVYIYLATFEFGVAWHESYEVVQTVVGIFGVSYAAFLLLFCLKLLADTNVITRLRNVHLRRRPISSTNQSSSTASASIRNRLYEQPNFSPYRTFEQTHPVRLVIKDFPV